MGRQHQINDSDGCFEPSTNENRLRFRYTGNDQRLTGHCYIRVILTNSLFYLWEEYMLTYQQHTLHDHELEHIAVYTATGEKIDAHTLTIAYHHFEQCALESINTAIVSATGSSNALLIHRKGLIYQDELQVGYKGSQNIAEMKYRLAEDIVKHSEMTGVVVRGEDRQAIIQKVVAAIRTEEEVRREYNDYYYLPCLHALLRCAAEQLNCPHTCLTRRIDNSLLRFDEQRRVVILAHPRYHKQISERMCQDESGQTVAPNNSAEVAVWPQHYLISRIDQTQQPPQTITLSDTIYRQADRSLLEAFYIYEADEESADFQPRQASMDIPHCQQDATLVQYLPDIFSKSNKECLHTIDIRNDIPALSIYLVNGISANDVAQVLSLPPDSACSHYGYEWYLLNRSHVITHPSNVKWSDVILVTWRCRTTLYRIEALAKSVLRNYMRRDPMRLAVQDVMITIKPSFQAHIMYNGQSLFLPHRLECLVTFQISHPVTTKKVLRYSFDPLSSRQPTYIENILDTALIPEALQTWSREILRQRIYDNMAIH